MKIKVTVIDDDEKEHSGEIELSSIKSIKKIKKIGIKNKKLDDCKGVGGEIRLLIDNNFFSKPKSLGDIKKELEREGYYPSKETLNTALRRDFVKSKKVLTRIKQEEGWEYVVRK